MPKPTVGQSAWGEVLNTHLDSIETTANAAETPAAAQAKADAAEAAAKAASLATTTKGAANGVAPLDADTLVPQANLPAHLTSGALTATVASQSYKGGTAEALQPFWAALAKRNTETVDIVHQGTSLWAGTGATHLDARLPNQLLAMLRARFPVADIIGGVGWGAGHGQLGGATTSTGVTNSLRGLGNRAARLTASGHTCTWGQQVGTKITVHGYAITAGDSVTVTIDGGAPTTITPGVVGRFSQTFTVARASHLVVVAWVAGTPDVLGINTTDGDDTLGIRMWDSSKGGAKAGDWLDAYGGSQDWINDIGPGALVDPDLVILDSLPNSATNVSAATMKTQEQARIDLWRTKTAAPILLWAAHSRQAALATIDPWDAYVVAYRELADENNDVTMVDMSLYVDTDTVSNGWLFDAYHPSNYGYAALAAILFEFLVPAGVGAGTTRQDSPYTTYRMQEQVRGSRRTYGADAAVVTDRVVAPPSATANLWEVTDATQATRHAAISKTGRFLIPQLIARGNPAGSAAVSATVDANAGQLRDIVFATTDSEDAWPSSRWILRTDASAESGADAGSNFLFMSRTDAGGTKKTIFSVLRSNGQITFGDEVNLAFNTTVGTKIGTDATQKIAFYGATPVVRPTGTPAAAIDAATTQALVNDLRSKLVSLGLIA